MNGNKYISRLLNVVAVSVVAGVMFTSCIGDGGETIPLEYQSKPATSTDIPSDDEATPNPSIDTSTATSILPNFGDAIVEENNGDMIAELYMPGLKCPGDDDRWLYLVGTGGKNMLEQNVWVSVDGTPKGCVALNNANGEVKKPVPFDFVFLVDNSGNMNVVGDIIARDLTSWGAELKGYNLDVKYGSVGYGRLEKVDAEVGVNGAKDICDLADLNSYLTRENRAGVMRTKGYLTSEPTLQTFSANKYSNCSGVCPVEALKYADEAFSFRRAACRVYLNFLDEANQPGGSFLWSVESVRDANVWRAYQGTVHTVYNGLRNFLEESLSYEYPWKLSTYTGGTSELDFDRAMTNVYLNKLTVTKVMRYSYVLRFRVLPSCLDDKAHDVRITVRSQNGEVLADKNFYVTFSRK